MEMEMDQIRDYSQFASSLKSERQNSSLFVGFTVEIWSTQLSFPVLKLFHFDCHFVSFLSLLESQCLVSYCKLINFTIFFFFFLYREGLSVHYNHHKVGLYNYNSEQQSD